jgi:hypothetical protein
LAIPVQDFKEPLDIEWLGQVGLGPGRKALDLALRCVGADDDADSHTDLGLTIAIARQIVESWGGDLAVPVSGGSAFRLGYRPPLAKIIEKRFPLGAS